MIKCRACEAEISETAKKCQACGTDQRNWLRRHPIWTTIICLWALGFAALQLGKTTSNKVLPPKDSPSGSEVDKIYLSAAGGYLRTQNEQGIHVASAMAGINTGETTLTDIRKAIKDARFVTNVAWNGDYLKSGELVVPDIFAEVDKKIRHSHELRDAAFNEYLEYWKDQNPAHIQSGLATLKRSEALAQEATAELTALIRDLRK